MDKLHIRLTAGDVELAADALHEATDATAYDKGAQDMRALEARLRYLLARSRQRAARTPAAGPGSGPPPEEG